DDYKDRMNDESLGVDEHCGMVWMTCGPKGYPGMAEVGNRGLPPKVLRKGITDMVRISDARMSGTAYGTVVLHVSPESAAGGPLGLVRTGDEIALDVPARTVSLMVDEEELERRRAELRPRARRFPRGYVRLYEDHVLQAHQGADFDFLVGRGDAEPHGGDPYLPPDDENALVRQSYRARDDRVTG